MSALAHPLERWQIDQPATRIINWENRNPATKGSNPEVTSPEQYKP
jgi:hypothetical protein